jgi:DNA-directed RNA polymerase specialized sigma24 family protein
MKSYNELKKQLNGLVLGIKECNFIPNELRDDITQDTWVKIIEKMADGTLSDDYSQIRGYTFQIVRNFCLAYHRDKEKKGTYELKWDVADDLDDDRTEYMKELKKLVEVKIQSIKYDTRQKRLIEMLFSGYSRKEVMDELNLTNDQYKYFRQGIVLKLKTDMKRKVKYVIKNQNKDWVNICCYTGTDVKQFFSDYTKRQVSSILYNNWVTPDGYYIEKSYKGKKKGTT